jgi:predicted NodU family carbamoyl transferase
MNILGISAYYHDSAAAFVRDGDIVAAAQEERFTRKKHDYGFPQHAIDYCLAEAQIGRNELDLVVFYDKPLMKFERILETYVSYSPSGFKFFLMGLPTSSTEASTSTNATTVNESLFIGVFPWFPAFLFSVFQRGRLRAATGPAAEGASYIVRFRPQC